LQSVSLTAEADAEAALAAGLNGRAARLFVQAFNADSSKTEAGFRAATIYAGPLGQPVEAVRVLRKLEKQTARPEARTRAANEIKKLEPAYAPLVVALIARATDLIDQGDAKAAESTLVEAAMLDPLSTSLATQRVRLAALGNEAQVLEAALIALSSKGVEIEKALRKLPRARDWAEQNWFRELLLDYRGADYAERTVNRLKRMQVSFRDCPTCPEMMTLPAGKFIMGSPDNEKGRSSVEGPLREITISQPFAVSVFELSWKQWDACVNAGECNQVNERSGMGGDLPVRLSLQNIQSYINWISRTTGKPYRLLSEAEWEYAARAGTSGRWSNNANEAQLCRIANHLDAPTRFVLSNEYCSDGFGIHKYAPVGSFEPNDFGLHDMHGNAWELVEDCYNGNYVGAPVDGTAWRKGLCTLRVMRGGHSSAPPHNIRSASRYFIDTRDIDTYVGLRVALTLHSPRPR
ncbi:MAG: SUMF1/EgtB/PvdO family nonheme iron enzyme, partial [Hyphomonadaceae bacterium]